MMSHHSLPNKSVTQRLVVSLIFKLFHRIGQVAPFTIGARLLPKNTFERYLECSVELIRLADITIPRSFFSEIFEHIRLYMFGNSSQEVFSTVAFIQAPVFVRS